MAQLPSATLLNRPETASVDQALRLMAEAKYEAAAKMCDQVLAVMPDNATAVSVRALAFWQLHRDPKYCIAEARRALAMAPDSSTAHNYLANILATTEDLDESKRLFEQALRLDPNNTSALFNYVDVTKFTEETPLIRSFYERFLSDEYIPAQREMVGFALAKVYDDLKMPQRAIEVADVANSLSNRPYNPKLLDDRTRDLVRLAQVGFDGVADSGKRASPPIFIVGMPRSGTTLVETILSRHPEVYAAGELLAVSHIEQLMGAHLMGQGRRDLGPHTMLVTVPKEVYAKRVQEMKRLVERQAERTIRHRYTDKMPMNAFKLTLISRLFPTAPIVYMRRHPLDIGLSCYFKRFTKGLEFAFHQEAVGHYYRRMEEHVEISRRIIPNPVLDLSYETLIEDFEPQVRRLLDFVGLKWNPACLNPEQTDRSTVMTASKWQVRQPVYSSSRARWKRYEPYIGRMIEGFGGMDWIEKDFEEGRAAGRTRN
ncbi:MAG: sulfotransferase [Hyphomicrobiaceae bacterium]|nr:sulfotransferase [Hyphomicrobiaceae bacterium]